MALGHASLYFQDVQFEAALYRLDDKDEMLATTKIKMEQGPVKD